MPTLPGLSLILDDENKVAKLEQTSKVEPRKSFQQWKNQHKDIFDNSTIQQRKFEKKQVRFETDNQTNYNFTEKLSSQRIPPPVSPNLELSYYKVPVSQAENYCLNEQKQCRQRYPNHNSKPTGHSEGFDKSIFHSGCNSKTPMASQFLNDKAYHAANEQQFNRIVRSEMMKDNCLSGTVSPARNEQRQCHTNCCQQGLQMNQNRWEMMDHPAIMNHKICNHGAQTNGCINEQREYQPHQQLMGQKAMQTFSVDVERNPKEQFTDDTLLGIMEEQQQHILLQQSQIMMQQKQNMMQQNQIFMLQHQVQQLLLRNGNSTIDSPNKQRRSTICEKTTPTNSPTSVQNRNGSTDAMCNGISAKSSIGVMTSFLGNMNDAMPKGMQHFNEGFKSTTKLANTKFIEKIGGVSPEEYSYKDSMLDKINDAIRNSSAMIDYRTNGTTNGYASPNQQPDVNIAAQA